MIEKMVISGAIAQLDAIIALIEEGKTDRAKKLLKDMQWVFEGEVGGK